MSSSSGNASRANPFRNASTWSLVRGLIVFTACKIPRIESRAPLWLKRAEGAFGHTVAYHTFAKWLMFDHFCAGRDLEELRVKSQELSKQGVGAILDYAAEAEIEVVSGAKKKPEMRPGLPPTPPTAATSAAKNSSAASSSSSPAAPPFSPEASAAARLAEDADEVAVVEGAVREVVEGIRRGGVDGASTPLGTLPIDMTKSQQQPQQQQQQTASTSRKRGARAKDLAAAAAADDADADAASDSSLANSSLLADIESIRIKKWSMYLEEVAALEAAEKGSGQSHRSLKHNKMMREYVARQKQLEARVARSAGGGGGGQLPPRVEWERGVRPSNAASAQVGVAPANTEAVYYAAESDLWFPKPAIEMNANVDRFLTCINDASELRSFRMPIAFAAVKLTALADPLLLSRVNAVLLGVRRDWLQLRYHISPGGVRSHLLQADTSTIPLQQCRVLLLGSAQAQNDMYRAPHAEFRRALMAKYGAQGGLQDAHIDLLLHVLDPNGKNGYVDYLSYVQLAADAILDYDTYRDDPQIIAARNAAAAASPPPAASAPPSPTAPSPATTASSSGSVHGSAGFGGATATVAAETATTTPSADRNRPAVYKVLRHLHRGLYRGELDLLRQFEERGEAVIQQCVRRRVRIMIDAEQSYYQMAIDQFTREMQRKYNKTDPVVLNTYQAYMETAEARVLNDLRRAERENWVFAAKIVRGAYMDEETALSQQFNYRCPIWASIDLTHRCYNNIADRLLNVCQKQPNTPFSILFGSHNANSIYYISSVVASMPPHCKCEISFAQLLGMADDLTHFLARNGHRVFKYLPYGPVKETLAYLMRRAQENRSIMKGPNPTIAQMKAELRNRVLSALKVAAVVYALVWLLLFNGSSSSSKKPDVDAGAAAAAEGAVEQAEGKSKSSSGCGGNVTTIGIGSLTISFSRKQ